MIETRVQSETELQTLAGPPVTSVSRDQLLALHAETGLTTALSTDVGDDLFYVDHVSNDPHYSYIAENRLRRSLLRTSSGWLLLADREKRDIWARRRHSYNTIRGGRTQRAQG